VCAVAPEYLAKVKAAVGSQGTAGEKSTATYDQAAAIFGNMMDKMSLTPEYPEFLTVPLCNAME
jgi:malate synthase